MTSEPKERPILFSAPMVRAILAGTKTQTRRLVKARHFPAPFHARCLEVGVATALRELHEQGRWEDRPFPYGRPGDRLWVRETWEDVAGEDGSSRWLHYRADGAKVPSPRDERAPGGGSSWRPSIHMPRWASRITLEVTDVRVERLQEISEEDAKAEGCEPAVYEGWSAYDPVSDGTVEFLAPPDPTKFESIRHHGPRVIATARDKFRLLWLEINGLESWDSNSWVWVVSFRRLP